MYPLTTYGYDQFSNLSFTLWNEGSGYRFGTGITPGSGDTGADIETGTNIFSAGKGDTFFVLDYSGSFYQGDSLVVCFNGFDSEGNQVTNYLNELYYSDFTFDEVSGCYARVTIPEKDGDGNDWGDVPGFICFQYTGM